MVQFTHHQERFEMLYILILPVLLYGAWRMKEGYGVAVPLVILIASGVVALISLFVKLATIASLANY